MSSGPPPLPAAPLRGPATRPPKIRGPGFWRITFGWLGATFAGCTVLALTLSESLSAKTPAEQLGMKVISIFILLIPALLVTLVPSLFLRGVIIALGKVGPWAAIIAGLALGLLFWVFFDAGLSQGEGWVADTDNSLQLWAVAGIAGGYSWWRIERPAWRRYWHGLAARTIETMTAAGSRPPGPTDPGPDYRGNADR